MSLSAAVEKSLWDVSKIHQVLFYFQVSSLRLQKHNSKKRIKKGF